MKKYFLLGLVLFSLSHVCLANELQIREFGLFAESNFFEKAKLYHGGIKINAGWEDFSLFYLFSVGTSSQGHTFGHIPGGVAVAEYIISSPGYSGLSEDSKEDFNTVLMIILLLLPDGIEFPIKAGDFFQIIPTFSWSGGEVNLYNNKDVLFSWGAGARFQFVKDNFFMGPYIGIKGIYSTGDKGLVLGFNLGAKW